MTTNEHTERLEYLRAEIRAQRISQGELIELADLAPYIEPGDVELLEWAGVPEFPADRTMTKDYAMETYASLIRKYAHNVETGAADDDLDELTRVYVTRLLHAASTTGYAGVVYPPSDRTRDDVSAGMHAAYSAGSLGVPLDCEPAWHAAIVRAAECIRGI